MNISFIWWAGVVALVAHIVLSVVKHGTKSADGSILLLGILVVMYLVLLSAPVIGVLVSVGTWVVFALRLINLFRDYHLYGRVDL